MNPTGPQELTDRARNSLQEYLYDELERGVKRGFEIATDYPGFLADNNPAPPVYRAAKALTRQACRAWARGQTPIRGPAADAVYGPLCEPYLDSIGEMPDDGSLNPPDFPGGQCAGVSYRITGSYREFFVPGCSSQNRTVNITVQGPVGALRPVGGAVACGAEGAVAQGFVVSTGTGDVGITSGLGSAGGFSRPIITVTRVDGQPDNCGSLPPTYTPPRTVTPPPGPLPPINVDLPGVGPVDVNVEFNPDGTVTVSLPDLGIEVTKGDPADTRPGDDLPPGDQGDPGSPQATGAGGESEGEAPEGNVLVGLRLNFVTIPPNARPLENEVYRGSCYVYMGGTDGLDQDFAGSMVRNGQFIFAERDNLTRWRVSANNGFDIRVTPYYRRAD